VRKTEPWWVCSECEQPIKKVGSKPKVVKQAEAEHKKRCPGGTYGIEQIEQRKR
jgi:hypothetical protein